MATEERELIQLDRIGPQRQNRGGLNVRFRSAENHKQEGALEDASRDYDLGEICSFHEALSPSN